jgi:hypothetical protein
LFANEIGKAGFEIQCQDVRCQTVLITKTISTEVQEQTVQVCVPNEHTTPAFDKRYQFGKRHSIVIFHTLFAPHTPCHQAILYMVFPLGVNYRK